MGTGIMLHFASLFLMLQKQVFSARFFVFLILSIEGNRRFERFGITRRACTRLRLRITHDGAVHGYARVGCSRDGLPGLFTAFGRACRGWIWPNPSCAANSYGHDV